MTRFKLGAALLIMFAMAAATSAAADPQWPNVSLDEPQWPNLPEDNLPDPRPNPNPSFIATDQVMDRILGESGRNARADATGTFARWPELPLENGPASFTFEVGARYWYSWGASASRLPTATPILAARPRRSIGTT